MIHPVIKGISAKILVTACILMQLAVMLPHHHHGGSSMPCINVFHCTGSCADTERHNCGCGSHHCGNTHPAGDARHHDEDGTPCALNLTDMLRLERERVEGPSVFSVQLFAVQAAFMRTLHDADAITCLNTLSRLDRKRPGVWGAIHTAYITAAIPPRAPSFTA